MRPRYEQLQAEDRPSHLDAKLVVIDHVYSQGKEGISLLGTESAVNKPRIEDDSNRYVVFQSPKGMLGSKIFSVIAFLLLTMSSTLFVFYLDAQGVSNAQNVSSSTQSVPLIVAWTKYSGKFLGELLLPTMRNCKYRCEVVDRKGHEDFKTAAAYIFNGRHIGSNLPKQTSEHLKILFLGSPVEDGSLVCRVCRDYFNATIGYRSDSEYFYPYGHFQLRSSNDPANDIITKEEILLQSKKSRGSLIFVSNCRTHSNRERIIRDLGKYTEITVRGECEDALSVNNNTKSAACETDCSDDALIATHRFYIAFENRNCDDYITEIFHRRISQLLVPVVLKRRIYEAAGVPKRSFIAADDFRSTEDLGNYLNFLRRNDTEYLRYFEWTKDFRKPNSYASDALCKLCEDIHRKKELRIDDIKKYFEKDQCF